MSKLSLKLKLFIFLIVFLLYTSLLEGAYSSLLKVLVAILASVLVDDIFYFLRNKKHKITESSLITGIICGFVLSNGLAWWIFALAGMLATLSKHLIRFKEKHIFNPAALGILLTMFFLSAYTQWKGAYTWYILVPVGLYFIIKIKRLAIVVTYYLTYSIIFIFKGNPVLDTILYANYFFMLVMLIEPKTTPIKLKEQIIFGLLAAIVSAILYALQVTYDPELLALLIVNLLFFLVFTLKLRKKGE